MSLRVDREIAWVLTSINASGQHVPLANGPIELWGRPVNQSAGLSGLGLGPPAVAELGSNHQEALGRRFWRYQPAQRFSLCKSTTDTQSLHLVDIFHLITHFRIC